MCKPIASPTASGHRGSAVNGRVRFCTAHTFARAVFPARLALASLLDTRGSHFLQVSSLPLSISHWWSLSSVPGTSQGLGSRDEWNTVPALKDLPLCVKIHHYKSVSVKAVSRKP